MENEDEIEYEYDEHVGCYAYPNCDEDPLGCCIEMGDEVEMYGYRE